MASKIRCSIRDSGTAIARRQAFEAYGSMSGEEASSYPYTGHLPDEHAKALLADAGKGDVDYVVYSYSTPIAWHTPKGWVVPDVKYSRTTSRHQGVVRRAVDR
jgi:hypothetical protein